MLTAYLHDRATLGRLFRADIPGAWPPALLDDDARREVLRMAEDGADPHFTCWYWILEEPATGRRTLIGSGGTAPVPGDPCTAAIGYSVLEEYQGRGYATEAVAALVPVIFVFPGIARICACTYPGMPASIRVLEKTGFACAGTKDGGEGFEEGTLRYLLER